MPTLLTWIYSGGSEGSQEAARRGEQLAYPGDEVVSDELGGGKVVRLDGGALVCAFKEGDEMVERGLQPGSVYAMASRERRVPRVAPTGREQSRGTTSLLGLLGAQNNPPPVASGKRPRGRGLGKSTAGASSSGTRAVPSRATAAATNAPKDAADAANEGAGGPSGLLSGLLADYSSDSASDGDNNTASPAATSAPSVGNSAKKRAAAGNVSFKALSASAQAEYRHQQYESRKDQAKQDLLTAPYLHSVQNEGGWLVKDSARGWHCRVCVGKLTRPNDKLSTGYGYEGSGEVKLLVPIPSSQKLSIHDSHPRHKLNIEMNQKLAQGASQAAVMGDANVYVSITPEDELYARTIRTVHTLVVRQMPLHDMDSLLKLQLANGCVVSFDHSHLGSDASDGGISTWLEAGVRVFKKEQRERIANSVVTALFPNGVPLGLLGDGSTDRSMFEQEAVVTRFLGSDGKPFNAFHDLAELDLKQSTDGRSPDAKCITECYANSLDQLNQHEGFLFMSDWRRALIGVSFDGASVMLGSQNVCP